MAGSRHDPVELGSDMDEDEALSYAIALSLQEQEVQDEQSSQIPSAPILNSRRNGTGSSGAGLSLLSFDRKKMEEERLQRLAKRRRSPTDDEDMAQVPPAKRMTPSEPSRTVAGFSPPSLLPYPNGAIKRTWAKGYPRTSEDIKIEEVLQKDKLELALLSSYQWDDEWLMSKLDLRKTKLLLLAFADNEAQKSEMRSNAPPGIKFVFPAMNGPGAMHSKLQLLKYPDYLRVVVPTANLVPYDWGETGVMENMVFLIDLPRLKDSALYRPTTFSTELGRFLSATGVGESMINSLGNYDFSRTKHLRFVYTIPGGHQGDSLKRIGYSGLGTSVASLGLATDDLIDVDFVVGALKVPYQPMEH
ncbi:Ff.00g076610.m01.CDS01 [Fusarium sp. VM40]|nr:Ff.00g076610.m01.CDS01 [Fusarium sp. VM40]